MKFVRSSIYWETSRCKHQWIMNCSHVNEHIAKLHSETCSIFIYCSGAWFICMQNAYLSRLNLREWRMAGSFCLRFHKWILSSAKALTSAPYGPNTHTHTQKKDSKFVIHYILNILFYFKRLNIQPKATGNVRKKDKTKREEMTIQMDRAELTSLTRNSSWMTADPLSCWQ